MAKRANPFVEDYVQQSKIHVGLKQFNNNEDRLQKVYERTLAYLFKGAKKSQRNDVIIGTENDNTTNGTDRKYKMKQLFIGKNGMLLHSGKMVSDKSSIKQCNCSSEGETQCAYCEVGLCYGCQHMCARCDRAYCTACMLDGSEGSEVCVSCYS